MFNLVYRSIRLSIDPSFYNETVLVPFNNHVFEKRLEFYFYYYWLPLYEERCIANDFHPLLVYHYFRLKNLAPERLELLKEFRYFKFNFSPIIRLYHGTHQDYSMKFWIADFENKFLLSVTEHDLLIQKKFTSPQEFSNIIENKKRQYLQNNPENENDIIENFNRLNNEISNICNQLEQEFNEYYLPSSSQQQPSSSSQQQPSSSSQQQPSSSSQQQPSSSSQQQQRYHIAENTNTNFPPGGGSKFNTVFGWGAIAVCGVLLVWRLIAFLIELWRRFFPNSYNSYTLIPTSGSRLYPHPLPPKIS